MDIICTTVCHGFVWVFVGVIILNLAAGLFLKITGQI